jgi:hypothetical protein
MITLPVLEDIIDWAGGAMRIDMLLIGVRAPGSWPSAACCWAC